MTSKRTVAILEALLVTFLWSSSYILIKFGLDEIPPMTFAAYRYSLAAIALLSYVLVRHRRCLLSMQRVALAKYIALGFFGYFIAQGLQFFGLYYLQAITVTFLLNMTPIFVLLIGSATLKELPDKRQFVGIGILLVGVALFFYGEGLMFDQRLGILLTLASGLGWAIYMTLTRSMVRGSDDSPVVLTSISMASGAIMMTLASFATQGTPDISGHGVIVIAWLALVNTAAAFFLWNRALRNLKAYEQSILQNSMLIQISILAIIFLGEGISAQKAFGIATMFLGVLLVIWKKGEIKK
ncbi:MAG: EamA family transporter [Candidatus Methanofastidiosa archaeon]|nr:EamA family transporter [Candidatus Methanofastidiosa archaeon]